MPETKHDVARFLIIGRLKEEPTVKTGKSGTSYCPLKLGVTSERSGREFTYEAVAFDDAAKDIAVDCHKADQVQVVGDLNWSKRSDGQGGWEMKLFARSAEVLERHAQNDQAAQANAERRADIDDIDF